MGRPINQLADALSMNTDMSMEGLTLELCPSIKLCELSRKGGKEANEQRLSRDNKSL